MKYTALYRQWRPDTFDEVVGQEHIVRTLTNQIKNGRIGHAYLFCGPRGTGKTSTAKIFARAINCLETIQGNPCGKCRVCRGLASGSSMDILEIDAASNNGVDEIRDLRDKVKFPPAVGRYKVYIIDEVHMLSMGAFNALLKTLEEPPEHIVFILATTEPHRLPATILSRCQLYDFKRITVGVIKDRLQSIVDRMGIQAEQEALLTIANWAEGGMRDALSLLDQCIGYSGDIVTNRDVLSILGTADQGFIFQFMEDLMGGNASNLLRSINRLLEDGRDIAVFLKDLIQHLRNLLLVKVCENSADILDVTESMMEQYRTLAQRSGEERLVRSIEILSSLEADLKWSTQPRVLVELSMVKICRPQQEESMEALLDRVRILEERLAEGFVVPQEASTRQRRASKEAKAQQTTRAQEKPPLEEPLEPGKTGDVEALWEEVLKRVKMERVALYPLIKDAKIKRAGGDSVNLVFPDKPERDFYIAAMEKESNRSYLEDVIFKITGNKVKVKCQPEGAATPEDSKGEDADDLVKKAIDHFGLEFVEVVEDDIQA